MIAETQARKTLARVVKKLKKAYGEPAEPAEEDPMARVVRAVLEDGASDRAAAAALRRMQETFVDWNEARVSTVYQLAETIEEAGDAERKARSLRGLCQAIFERENAVDPTFLVQESATDARGFMDAREDVDPVIGRRALLLALGHACVPVTADVSRVSLRLDLVREDYDAALMQRRLERLLPNADMPLFFHVVTQHARKRCLVSRPKCKGCPISSDCLYLKDDGGGASGSSKSKTAANAS